METPGLATAIGAPVNEYVMEDQVGFLLRVALQRHTAIFLSRMVEGLTQTQFAALVTLYRGECSQNELARLISLDAATVNGVIGRMKARGFVAVKKVIVDKRLRLLRLTPSGRDLIERAIPAARLATAATLEPLDTSEAAQMLAALKKLA